MTNGVDGDGIQGEIYNSSSSNKVESEEFYQFRLGMTKEISSLEIEIMLSKAAPNRPISVEYVNDIPGTAFGELNGIFTFPSPTYGRKGKNGERAASWF